MFVFVSLGGVNKFSFEPNMEIVITNESYYIICAAFFKVVY